MQRIYFLGISIIDLGISLLAMLAIFTIAWRYYFRELALWKFIIAAIVLTIPLGIIFHVIFGVNTQINWKLGLSNKPERQ